MPPFRWVLRGELVRGAVLIFLVSIFWMALDSWLFKQSTFLKVLEVVIRLIVPVMLIVLFRKYVVPPKARILLFIYGILSFYMLFIAFFSENPNLVILNTVKILHVLVFFVALLLVLHPRNFSYHFLYVPVFLGFFLSIQTIILFILMQTGHPPFGHIATLVGYKNMDVLSFGIWGYAHGMQAAGSSLQVYRAISFFGEPTEFAGFVEIATIISFGLYRVKRDKRMLLVACLCAVSLILTFSMTAYVVVFLTYCFYKVVLGLEKAGLLKQIAVTVGVLFFIILVVAFYFYVSTHPSFYGQSRLGFAFGHSPREITIRLEALQNALLIFRENLLGVGLIGHADSKILGGYSQIGARSAPLGWIISAGVVGITAQLTILFYLLRKIVVKQIRMAGRIERYIALSFVICVLHHCLAGAWFSTSFFYLVACLIASDAYQFSFCGNRNKNFT